MRWLRKLPPVGAAEEDSVVTRDGTEEEMPVVVDSLVADVSDCLSSA